MAEVRLSRSSSHDLLRLAEGLALGVQLSFDERRASSFAQKAKETIARTRSRYRALTKSFGGRIQATQGVEVLLDNFYVVEGALAELSLSWKRKITLHVPQSKDAEGEKQPRVYLIARALVRETNARIEREMIVEFLKAYQKSAPLSVRELDIFPDMLRLAFVEEILRMIEANLSAVYETSEADRWYAQMLSTARRRDAPLYLKKLTATLSREYAIIPQVFGLRLLHQLEQAGKESDLRMVCKWLKLALSKQGANMTQLSTANARAERTQTTTASNAVSGLRYLAQVRWDKIALELNTVNVVLAKDPADAFLALSDETRSQYQQTVARIADGTGSHDVEVAREALRLARRVAESKEAGAERLQCVGYYLVDKGVSALEQALGYQPSVIEKIRVFICANSTSVYLGFLGVGTLLVGLFILTASGATTLSVAPLFLMFIVTLVLTSEITTAIAHFLFTRILKPKPLPALDLAEGVGAERRTFVVVPSMFRDEASAKKILRKMEVNFAANRDPDIFYALLLDFNDAPREKMPDDADRIKEFTEGVADLNGRYPSLPPRFTLLYRERKWNLAEGAYMGWERKRGKLREFNRLLRGKETSYAGSATSFAQKYGHVRYVITLDEDTELLRDGARSLIGTIDHPLNRPTLDHGRRVVVDGYGIIMPRTALRFLDGNTSVFAHLFGSFPGIDAYSSLASDFHQDLFGEAIFHGKGIYDVDIIEATMAGRIPENTVLSHDLLEGLYARAGMASGVHIFEGFPSNYREYMERLSRWIRGDWQIVPWLFRKRGYILSPIARYRIFDNLRRSVLPIAASLAVLFSVFSPADLPLVSTTALLALGSGQLVSAILNITGHTFDWRRSLSGIGRIELAVVGFGVALVKTVFLGTLALHNAIIAADAITRSMWRLFVSKKKLLEWRTAYVAAVGRKNSVQSFVRFMWRSVCVSLLLVSVALYNKTLGDLLAVLWISSWVSAPFLAALASVPRKNVVVFSKSERMYLRMIATRTYWFFLDLATKEEQWLVPDHLQEEPENKRHVHGLGISPTNLGMYLVSLSSARALGLSSLSEYCERIIRAFTSMEKMVRYRGHFFNWYELKELSPLAPRYVSSVDSANLALSLHATRGGLLDACKTPIINTSMFEGLQAQLAVLLESCEHASADVALRSERASLNEVKSAAGESLIFVQRATEEKVTPRRCDLVLSGVIHHAVRTRNALETLRLEGRSGRFDELFLAARHVESSAESYRSTVSQYLSYAMVPAAASVANNPKLHALYAGLSDALWRVPSVGELAGEKIRQAIESVGMLEAIVLSELSSPEKERATLWYADMIERLSESEKHAKETERSLKEAAAKAEAYAREMDFSFLYNNERGLFHIGYNSIAERMDGSFYDLFASEANSASIVSIAKHDVPWEHWGYLGRKLIKSGRGDPIAASWAGSLFEYLGTLIYFDVPRESFWGVSAQRAIAAHRFFARRYRIPWGMGESASSRRDEAENYHYQAFGEPSLGFKRDLSESIVVAPYTSALALSLAPKEALSNFARLAKEGGFGRYGFYDAIDFTDKRKKGGRELSGIPARIYYAHHQGFILSSIANALLSGWVRRMVAEDPEMEAATQLFEERMPEGVPAEGAAVLTPQVGEARHVPKITETRRKYLPWRTKEATSLFISSGEYRLRVTTGGGGESRFGDINITRAEGDMLRESVGTFFYLYDAARQKMWSPTYMPVKDAGDKHAVSAGEQVVVFDKTVGAITSSLLVTALSGDNGELRELTLTNTGDTEALLSFGVCAELSLARNTEEFIQPNYERLFVATEDYWGGQAIIAVRPDPRDRARTIAAGFLLACDGKLKELHAIREKEIFYGSPQAKVAPPILADLSRANQSVPRYTLDSVAAFAGRILLRPRETRRISFLMLAGNSKEEILLRLKSYRNHRRRRQIGERADLDGGRFLTDMGITASQADTYRALASMVLARAMKSGGTEATPAARPWVAALWKMSISGSRPILLLSVSGVTDLPVVRQVLSCHSYFVKKGIAVDIVIFNDHFGGYLKTFEDEVDFLINTHRTQNEHAASAVFHVRVERLNAYEHAAMLAAATLRVDARKSSLSDAVKQLLRAHGTHARMYPSKFEPKQKQGGTPRYESLVRDAKDRLAFWNGVGGYDESAKEYVVYSEKGLRAPRPWSHIVANSHIGFLATDRGMSFTWTRNSYDNKLTIPYNDPLSESTGEAFYLRDEETGACVSPLPLFGNLDAAHEIRFGRGYVTYRFRALNLDVELLLYTGTAEPVKYYRLKVVNNGRKKRTLALFGYFELLMGSFLQETRKHLSFEAREGNTLVAMQNYRNQFLDSRTFVGIVGGADEFSVSREEFLGRRGDIRDPVALKRKGLSSIVARDEESAAALKKSIVLAPGKTEVITFFLGETDERKLERTLLDIEQGEYTEEVLVKAKRQWGERDLPHLTLPDPTLAALANHFLPYQILASRIHARLGFYQIGGAYGFRDQLQDALAMLWNDPKWTRKHILAAARHQFREGDVLSWWQSHNDFGARTRLSDQQLWLPHVTLRYVRFTGNSAILDEVIPYLKGDIPDKADHPSIFGIFEQSTEKSSLYEHLVRAVEHSLTQGVHGLPLMGAADWNDAMNRVGVEGEGESVWLAWFLITVLDEMSVVTEERGDPARAARYRSHAKRYRQAIKKFGWDGRWYRRAFTDSGALVGGSGAKAFRLDSIAQSWAYFADGKTEESKQALQSAKDELSIYEGHVPLAWPPSSRSAHDLGTISDYPPGVRENGSQYNHAALWLAQALFASGDPDAGKIIVDAVNPFKRSETPEKLSIYRGEPYVVAAEVYSQPTYPGRAGWTWYTASAGVLYRTILEYILGLKREGDRLSFSPSFPSGWKDASVVLPFGGSRYRIIFSVEDDAKPMKVSLDGVRVSGGVVTLNDDGKEHKVVVAWGRGNQSHP